MTIKKLIITKPKTNKSFDMGEMLFVDEEGIVTKMENGKVVIIGKWKEAKTNEV